MRRVMVAALAAGVALLGGVGCGSSSGGGGGSTTTNNGEAAHAKAVSFSECMRQHGVPHFPDPNAENDYDFGIDVSEAVWTSAVSACKAFQPPGTLSGRRSSTQQSTAVRFATCVRAHGVRDFPDPANGDPMIDTTKIPSSNRPGGMTILNAAIRSCHDLLAKTLARQK